MSKKTGIQKKCKTCGTQMYVKKCLSGRKKYCSRTCLGKNTALARGEVERNIIAWNKGKSLHYDVWNKGMKGYAKGSQNGMWKGDKVGYHGIHKWIAATLGKATICTFCTRDRNDTRIEWANLSSQYKRDIADWMPLCSSCHYWYDRVYKHSAQSGTVTELSVSVEYTRD